MRRDEWTLERCGEKEALGFFRVTFFVDMPHLLLRARHEFGGGGVSRFG